MGRIPAAELEALKSRVDLVALIQSKGVELKKHGKDLIGRCPFHNDKTPSLVVTPDKGLWHCMGACGAGGTVIDWVMRAEGVSFRHAVALLQAGDVKLLLSQKMAGVAPTTVPKLPPAVSLDADDETLLKEVVEYYHQTLLKTPAALSYLEARGIRNTEAIAKFKIGFADRTLGLGIPHANRVAGAKVREQLKKIGLYNSIGREHFDGSFTIPVLSPEGKVTEVYGRKITRGLRVGTQLHTYLPGPHRGVWNPEALKSGNGELILCEALIDALTFWVHGFRNVTAAYGVNGFTADHLAAFIENGVRRVLIAFDRDEAGDQGAERVAAKLASEGIECRRVQFPKGMDANDYARKVKPEEQALRVCLESAVPMNKPKAASFSLAAETPQPSAPLGAANPPKAPELAAQPVAATPRPTDVPTDVRGEEVYIQLGEREYRVRGLFRNASHEVMKINLRASSGIKSHVDQLDLYQAKARTAFVQAAAREFAVGLDVIQRDLGRLLWKLEELQEEKLSGRRGASGAEEPKVELTDAEEREALEFLRRPDLLPAILADFEACGVVGEETNKCVAYIAAVSRKLEDPLAVIIQSTSAAGKSSLMEAVLAMVPPEDRMKYSAMTGQSLFYMGETSLKNRVLAIAEEQGARNASYALKLLQSEGEISIASTGKDPHTGKLITHEYRVEGPVMLFLTTTAPEMDEELLNRCLVLSVDEDQSQTRAIHERQRKAQTLDGLLAKRGRSAVIRKHQNAQRLLRPLLVANPFAEELRFIDTHTRTRRDHVKYLALIRAIALLHQHSREVKWIEHAGSHLEYIEVQRSDIEAADRLFAHVSGRLLDDLPPQARRLLTVLGTRVLTESAALGMPHLQYRFTRKQVRSWMGWSDFQVQVHLGKLVAQEHVAAYRDNARGASLSYSLIDEIAADPESPIITQRFEHLTQHLMGGSSPLRGVPLGSKKSEEAIELPANFAALRGKEPNAHGGSQNENVIPTESGLKERARR